MKLIFFISADIVNIKDFGPFFCVFRGKVLAPQVRMLPLAIPFLLECIYTFEVESEEQVIMLKEGRYK